jgi:signal transduction histidine kinase
VLGATSDAMLLVTPDLRVHNVSDALLQLVGRDRAAVIGQPLGSIRMAQGTPLMAAVGYTQEQLRAACEALAAGECVPSKTFATPGPTERLLESVLAPVRDSEGAVVGWLLSFRDLTAERQAAHLMEELTYMLVHDLRSPLTALMGTVEMLKALLAETARAHAVDELLVLAEQSTNRMLLIVDALLDISRLESGEMPVHRESLAVLPLLESAAAHLLPLANTAQITIEVSAAPDLPPLYADPDLIIRVLHNLLDNAVKFTPDFGHIRLWAEPASQAEPQGLVLAVSDDGPGVPLEAQSRLFEKFQQVPVTRGRRPGTGLGLPFCKLAVEAHGGRIWIESEPEQGTTVRLWLPGAE